MIPTLVLLLACSGEPEPVTAPPAEPTPATPLAPEQLEQAIEHTLTPSPNETRLAVERAGITLSLGTLIPERNWQLDQGGIDRAALRTGVLLGDLVLTVKEAEKPWLVTQLQMIHDGLQAMGAGEGLLSTVADMKASVENDAVSREDLLRQLDDLVGMVPTNEGVGPEDNSGPLLQAGAWLGATNLTSRAVLRSGQLEAADTLLRQKAVAEHFLSYVSEGEGEEKAGDVQSLLKISLTRMIEISDQETIGRADVEEVRDQTQALIDLL